MITTPEQFNRFKIAQLRGACRLLASGLQIRGTTGTKALQAAEAITKRKYKGKLAVKLRDAAEDLTLVLNESRHDYNI